MPQSDHPTRRRGRLRHLAASAGCAAMLAVAASGTFGLVGASTAGAATGDDATPAPAPCAIQPEGNARYVAWAYQEVLFRCPDASGLAYWTDQLDSGTSRMAFLQGLDYSDENLVNNNIVALYEGVLHRAPTDAEIAEWLPKFRAEHADGDLFATLYATDTVWDSLPETGRTEAFIAMLYSAVLDRVGDQSVADPQGFSFFTSILGTNPTEAQRYHVAYEYFEQSTENAHDWVWASFQSSLGRLPDATGGVYWTDWVLNKGFRTFDMCLYLKASNEAYANAQAQQNPPPEPAH